MSSRHAAPRGRRRLPIVVGTVVVVLAVVVGAFLLVRGGQDEPAASDDAAASETTATPQPSGSPSATPSATDTSEVPDEPEATQPTETPGPGEDGASTGTENSAVAALAGTWSTEDNFWVLRLTKDGTFEEDYDGVSNTRSGTFTVKGTKFTLRGGDGNDNSGTIVGKNTLRFDADTVLERRR